MKPTIKMQNIGIDEQKHIQLTPLNASYVERKKWYLSTRWQTFRLNFLKEHPLCDMCVQKGFFNDAAVVDHVDGHNIDTWKDTFWIGPFQGLCQSCHSKKTTTEDQKNKPQRMTAADRARILAEVKKGGNIN